MATIDELNELLDLAETIFSKANTGISASAEVMIDAGVALKWMKHDGEWGFWIQRGIPIETTDLKKCSMRVRILASKHLKQLLEALRRAQDAHGVALDKACENVRQFIKEHE